MPHVIVTLWPGKSEQQKHRLGGRNHKRCDDCPQLTERSSCPWRWKSSNLSLQADIKDKWDSVYKKPGYNPLE